MADTTCSDEFFGHNPALSDHNDIASSDDSCNEDPVLGTQGIDYTPWGRCMRNAVTASGATSVGDFVPNQL